MAPSEQFPVFHAVTQLDAQAIRKKIRKRKTTASDNTDDGNNRPEDFTYGPIDHNKTKIYDVKFYPYTTPDEPAVFAVVTYREVYIYRPSTEPNSPVELLRVFQDPDRDANLNSLVWSQDLNTGDPLICFAGAGAANIKILNVVKGEFVRTLTGHGGAINDLAVSPLSPAILASASADHSIRLWNLDPAVSKQPCAAILASPDAHKQSVLGIAFHKEGKYMLSAGTDTMINLWAVPEVPGRYAGSDKLDRVFFPHFSSTEVHADYVDCLRFHGDLILSHAAFTDYEDKHKKNSILLWKIDGFNSADPVPDRAPMSEPGKWTRSAFGGRFQRLLTFNMPNSSPFYMRFSLFDAPGHHPILGMGDEKSRFLFWDLYALERGPAEAGFDTNRPRKYKKRRGGYKPRRTVGGLRGASVSTTGKDSTPSGMGNESEGDDYETAVEENDDDGDDDDGGDERSDVETQAQTESPDVSVLDDRLETPSSITAAATPDPVPRSVAGRPARSSTSAMAKRVVAKAKSAMQKAKDSRFDVSDPFRPIAAHHMLILQKYNFTCRQMAWSNCGSWCVATGEVGIMCIFRRSVGPMQIGAEDEGGTAAVADETDQKEGARHDA